MDVIEMANEGGATDAEFEQRVRELAYRLWEDDGRQDGRADEYWFIAVRQLGADSSGADGAARTNDELAANRASRTAGSLGADMGSNARTGTGSKR